MKSQPIGIFDSGVGGVSVAKWVQALMPNEDIIYFADTLYSPYGEKPISVVEERTFAISEMLKELGVKLIVVACNTATVNTISRLREKLQLPIVGVEPGIKPACERTKNNQVGVLATNNTLASPSFKLLCEQYRNDTNLVMQACPEFVTLVEQLDLSSEHTQSAIDKYLRPLKEQSCDQIVLGCTHFSFLKNEIAAQAGSDVQIIDTGMPVAKQVLARLNQHELLNTSLNPGTKTILTSGNEQQVTSLVEALWHVPLD